MDTADFPHLVILLHAEGIACRRLRFDKPYVHDDHKETLLKILRDEAHYKNPIILEVMRLHEKHNDNFEHGP